MLNYCLGNIYNLLVRRDAIQKSDWGAKNDRYFLFVLNMHVSIVKSVELN